MRKSSVVLLVVAALIGLMLAVPPPSQAEPLAGPSKFAPLPPTRILDTRIGLGAPQGIRAAGTTLDLQVTQVGGVPSTDVTAVVLNVTVTGALGGGYVQVFPTAQANIGDSSNLNIEYAGQTIPNTVVAPVGVGGKVTIYTQGGGHLIADVFGYFVLSGPTAAGRYLPLVPVRLSDTRSGQSLLISNPGDVKNCGDFATWPDANRYFWYYRDLYGDVAGLDGDNNMIPCESQFPSTRPSSPQKPADPMKSLAGVPFRIPILNTYVPGTASAVALNVTSADGTPGYAQIVPTNGPTALGASSNLNVSRAGDAIANLVIVPVGADGTVTIYTETPMNIIVDVQGFFTGPTDVGATAGLFVPLRPSRLLDTRNGIGAPAAKVGANSSVSLPVRGAGGAPPTGVAAAMLNVTATQATAPGFVHVFPAGQATPGSSSNLNVSVADQTIPNAAIVAIYTSDMTVYTSAGSHLLADISGYFTEQF